MCLLFYCIHCWYDDADDYCYYYFGCVLRIKRPYRPIKSDNFAMCTIEILCAVFCVCTTNPIENQMNVLNSPCFRLLKLPANITNDIFHVLPTLDAAGRFDCVILVSIRRIFLRWTKVILFLLYASIVSFGVNIALSRMENEPLLHWLSIDQIQEWKKTKSREKCYESEMIQLSKGRWTKAEDRHSEN